MKKYNPDPLTTQLPAGYCETILQKNLDALFNISPVLVNRLCLPTKSEHITFNEQGHLFYRLHNIDFPLSLQLSNNDIDRFAHKNSDNILFFGINDGAHLKKLLAHDCPNPVQLWERDPWLLRLFLMRTDFSSEINGRKIEFYLGIDILKLANEPHTQLIFNPISEKIYSFEKEILQSQKTIKKAMVCTGELFIEDICLDLSARNYSIYQIDVNGLAIEEIRYAIQTFKPEFIFSINYSHGLAELCQSLSLPLIIWEIDPAKDQIEIDMAIPGGNALFTYRKKNIPKHEQSGFAKVKYLPLASNTQKRKVQQCIAHKYKPEVAFVGSSMLAEAQIYKQQFIAEYNQFTSSNTSDAAEKVLQSCLDYQRQDYSRYSVESALKKIAPAFYENCVTRSFSINPIRLIDEAAAAEKRLNYMVELREFNTKIWGDSGWQVLSDYGIQYMGMAGHSNEINQIYSGSKINLDISRLYQMDIVTMRVFDILACGGFLITEYNEALGEIFTPGEELETYRNIEELVDKIRFYLRNFAAAATIANKGKEMVCANHKISDRVDEIFKFMT